MDDAIRFERRSLSFRLLTRLFRQHVLSGTTCHLLRVAFEHGGYIAGGFGTVLARQLVLGEGKVENSLQWAVRDHLGQPIVPPERTWRYNVGLGDIDVWFADQASVDSFINDPRRLRLLDSGRVHVAETITGTGIEHLVPGDAKVQVITRFLMPIEEQLSRFDIYNGMVAYTEDEVFLPEHWEALESQRVLHVSVWKLPWTVNRFFKWLRRKGYNHVTPVTADAVVQQTVDAVVWLKEHGTALPEKELQEAADKNELLGHLVTMPANIQHVLQPVFAALTADRLLEVSALFRPDARQYDLAMQEIRKRMPL